MQKCLAPKVVPPVVVVIAIKNDKMGEKYPFITSSTYWHSLFFEIFISIWQHIPRKLQKISFSIKTFFSIKAVLV